MNDSKIPVRYAKAFFELSEEKGLTENIQKDVLIIKELVKVPELSGILNSPIIKSVDKKKLMLSVSGKLNDLTLSFIDMVFSNKREKYFADISRNYLELYKKNKNIKTVELVTAVDIDADQKEKFKHQILQTFKADIALETKVDKNIIGGFIVQVDDKLYDASVKRQLQKMQNSLLNEKI